MNVTFYSYQGKPNEVPKTLGTAVRTEGVNLITESFPCLTLTLELSDSIDANYCTFKYPTTTSRTYYWFITNVTKFERLYRYELALDRLCTYWNDFKTETQMIERSASLTPTNIMVDTLWKTGKGLDYNQIFSSVSSANSPFKTDFTGSNFVLMTACKAVVGSGQTKIDLGNSPMSEIYSCDAQTIEHFANWLWSSNVIDNIKKWFQDPISSVIKCILFPFDTNITSQTVVTSLHVGDLTPTYNGNSIPSRQFKDTNIVLDLGYIDISSGKFEDFRDFPPYTTYKLYLPYVGFVDLSASEFYSSNRIYVKYYVNVVTGSTLVTLSASTTSTYHQIVSATLGSSVPITESGMANIERNLAIGISGLAMTAFGAPYLGQGTTETHSTKTLTSKEYSQPNIRQVQSKFVDVTTSDTESKTESNRGKAFAWMREGQTFVNSVVQPANVQTLGNMGGTVYRNLSQVPFVMVYRTKTLNDTYQTTKYGKLVMEPKQISTLSGYCKLHDCNLPMKGLPVEVYDALVADLEGGFYIN